ncbi:MAG TPA: hypothetical protein VFX78_02435 [Candidatus Eisenbacteria bacterium]|nr:hypothetical protein [Candidatus Eisenbacteria bacterium]
MNTTRVCVLRIGQLLVLGGLAILPGCSDDDHGSKSITPTKPPPTPFVEDSLVFRTSGGSVIEMGNSAITCCGFYDPGFINERTMRVMYYDPTLQEKSWVIQILIDAAGQGATYTLPANPVPPHKVPTVTLFAHFGEYSSDEEMASGTITLNSFECGASTMSVDFSVDATLESETSHGSTISVQGRFRAVYPKTECEP